MSKAEDRSDSSAERDDALAAVEAALERESVTEVEPDARQRQELALVLRDLSPAPTARFTAELDERVAAGFPRRAGRPAAPDARLRALVPTLLRHVSPPVLAGAGALLVAVAVGLPLAVSDRGPVSVAPDGAGAPPSTAAPRSSLPEAVAPASGEDSSGTRAEFKSGSAPPTAPGESRRRVARSASLTLAAPDERLDAVADGVTRTVERRGGFVLDSSLSLGEDASTAGGSFDLRVPARRLRATIGELAALGSVRARSQDGDDVTARFVSVEDRLLAARAERRGLLRRLERGGSPDRIRAVREQLELVLAEVRSLRSQLRRLRERTTYAKLSVTLRSDEDAGAAPGSTGAALEDALASLRMAFNLGVRALGVLIPLSVLALVGALVIGAVRRRRRESVLA